MNFVTYFAKLVFFTLVCFGMDLSGAAKKTLDRELFASVHPEADQFVRSQSAPPGSGLSEDDAKAAKKKADNKKKREKEKARKKAASGAGAGSVTPTSADVTPLPSPSPTESQSPARLTIASPVSLPVNIAQIKPLAKPMPKKPGEVKSTPAPLPASESPVPPVFVSGNIKPLVKPVATNRV